MNEHQKSGDGDGDGGGGVRFLPPEAVRSLLTNLTKTEHARLAVSARHFGAAAGVPWEDILQEAFRRTLDTRSCPVDIGILTFLFQAMRSIASGPISARRKARDSAAGVGAVRGRQSPEQIYEAISPEDEALSRIYHRRRLEAVTAAISGDQKLMLLVDGLEAGFRGKDLEEWVGVDTLGLAAIRKRLTRTLYACCPEGSGL